MLPASHPPTADTTKMRQSVSGFSLAGAAAQLILAGDVICGVAIGISEATDCAHLAEVRAAGTVISTAAAGTG